MRRQLSALAVAVATAGAFMVVPGVQAGEPLVTLTIGVVQDLSSPNVAAGYLVPDFELWNLQYATLTNRAADDFEVIPGLAESWDVSEDGLTFTYHLRSGLKWSDGEPLTADDVAYTINRSRDEEWSNHYATTANLDATADDATTVTITSSVPDPKLPVMDVYIVPQHVFEAVSAEDLGTYDGLDGIGSGPFTLKNWKSGQEWTMVANPNYYGGTGDIDQVIFRVFTNPDAMVAALQKGEIDAAHGIPASGFETLDNDPNVIAVAGSQGGFAELAMNGMAGGIGDGHPALLDVTVRHAIAHAIDRDVLFDRVLLGLGQHGVTIGVSPDPSWQPDIPAAEQYGFDPAKAKQLLDEAGYLDTDNDGIREMPDGGEPLVFRYAERSEGTIGAPVREFVTGWLNDVGIGTEVSVYDDDQLYEVTISGEYDLFVWGWTPFADPDPLLSYFTCSEVTSDVEEPGNNDANWCDPKYDALYEQQKVELDPVKRHEIVQEMLRYFYDNGTYIVLFEDSDLQAYRTDRFVGWLRQPINTGPVLFSNSSPTYTNLRLVGGDAPPISQEGTVNEPSGGSGGGDDGLGTGGIIAIAAGVIVLVGGLVLLLKSRGSRDERE